MMTRVSWLAACLMVLAVSQTAHAVTLSEFLTDDTYRLFREKVREPGMQAALSHAIPARPSPCSP